jgi:hypothetical protein
MLCTLGKSRSRKLGPIMRKSRCSFRSNGLLVGDIYKYTNTFRRAKRGPLGIGYVSGVPGPFSKFMMRTMVSSMDSQLLSPNSEAAIWARLMLAQKDELSSEAAEFLLAIDFGERDRQRMKELADRSQAGTLRAEERMEFDGYSHVGNLLAVRQSKARLALKRKPPDRRHS